MDEETSLSLFWAQTGVSREPVHSKQFEVCRWFECVKNFNHLGLLETCIWCARADNIYIYIRIQIHIHMSHTYTYTYIYVHIRIHIHTYIYTYIYTHYIIYDMICIYYTVVIPVASCDSQGGGQRRLTAYELAERAGHTKAFVSWIAELNRPSKQLLLNRLFKHV
jgi:hypothetical protein